MGEGGPDPEEKCRQEAEEQEHDDGGGDDDGSSTSDGENAAGRPLRGKQRWQAKVHDLQAQLQMERRHSKQMSETQRLMNKHFSTEDVEANIIGRSRHLYFL